MTICFSGWKLQGTSTAEPVRKASSLCGQCSGASLELDFTLQREEIFPKLAAICLDRQDSSCSPRDVFL